MTHRQTEHRHQQTQEPCGTYSDYTEHRHRNPVEHTVTKLSTDTGTKDGTNIQNFKNSNVFLLFDIQKFAAI